MSTSSGQDLVEDLFRFVECADCDCAECEAREEPDAVCSFAHGESCWVDPELNAWGWTCPTCGLVHRYDSLDSLPGF